VRRTRRISTFRPEFFAEHAWRNAAKPGVSDPRFHRVSKRRPRRRVHRRQRGDQAFRQRLIHAVTERATVLRHVQQHPAVVRHIAIAAHRPSRDEPGHHFRHGTRRRQGGRRELTHGHPRPARDDPKRKLLGDAHPLHGRRRGA
jgi:hypothetical protein